MVLLSLSLSRCGKSGRCVDGTNETEKEGTETEIYIGGGMSGAGRGGELRSMESVIFRYLGSLYVRAESLSSIF